MIIDMELNHFYLGFRIHAIAATRQLNLLLIFQVQLFCKFDLNPTAHQLFISETPFNKFLPAHLRLRFLVPISAVALFPWLALESNPRMRIPQRQTVGIKSFAKVDALAATQSWRALGILAPLKSPPTMQAVQCHEDALDAAALQS